jgi:site-specific recombinase XerD
MTGQPTFPTLLERFFTQRLMQQRQASTHTIASYRDTFRLLLQFAQKRLRRAPSALALEDIDAPLVVYFLDELEKVRDVTARTRNFVYPLSTRSSATLPSKHLGMPRRPNVC